MYNSYLHVFFRTEVWGQNICCTPNFELFLFQCSSKDLLNYMVGHHITIVIFPSIVSFKPELSPWEHFIIGPFNNDAICGKALKSVSFVLYKFSQIANTEPELTTVHIGTKGVHNLDTSSVSMISHQERLLPQCYSAKDLIIQRVYASSFIYFYSHKAQHSLTCYAKSWLKQVCRLLTQNLDLSTSYVFTISYWNIWWGSWEDFHSEGCCRVR